MCCGPNVLCVVIKNHSPHPSAMPLEELPKAAPPPIRELSESEKKNLLRKRQTTLRELRVFLRDATNKLMAERRFKEFTKPVDPEEVKRPQHTHAHTHIHAHTHTRTHTHTHTHTHAHTHTLTLAMDRCIPTINSLLCPQSILCLLTICLFVLISCTLFTCCCLLLLFTGPRLLPSGLSPHGPLHSDEAY